MKHFLLIVFMLISANASKAQRSRLPVIPEPASVIIGKDSLRLSQNIIIKAALSDKLTAQFLADDLKKNWHINATINPSVPAKKKQTIINLITTSNSQLPVEGYQLKISPKGISISGKSAGLFYGVQTLLQLLPLKRQPVITLPCLQIHDKPRYAYRGLMLDVSRHFFSVAQIKDLLNLMAYYKLNRFHWHLTDDQGWRLEIKSYPHLTSVGAWRVPRNGDFGDNMLPPQSDEKATDGGFYTQEQVKEVIRYATERHIEVMPEIDIPGHSMAAVAAYPELSVTKNRDTKVNPGSSFARWFPGGGFEMYADNTLNPTDEYVYTFLDKVLGEVAALFPYPYLHIGGDECFKGFWEKDASVKAFMQQHQIKDTHALQSYFIARVNHIVASKHKKLIGWDEILDGGLSDSVAVMGRFGEKKAIAQIRSGHDVILAPGDSGLYFDYAQSTSDMEPDSHGGNSPIWKTYQYNPVPPGLTSAEQKHILGIEACVWTEHIPSVAKLQYMLLPRMLALAECAWTDSTRKSYPAFADDALPAHLLRFDQSGINYRVPTVFNTIDTTIKAKDYTLKVKSPLPGAKIYYTVSNRQPGDADHLYTEPITFKVPNGKKLIIKTIVITPAGRRSVATKTEIDNTQP